MTGQEEWQEGWDDEWHDEAWDDERAGGSEEAWEEEGHEWVGARLARDFGKSKPSIGRIVRWLPAGGSDDEPALFHMLHDDGDEEDLEEHEVAAGLARYEQTTEEEIAQARVCLVCVLSACSRGRGPGSRRHASPSPGR